MSESIVVDLVRIYTFWQLGYHETVRGFGRMFPVLEQCAVFQGLGALREMEKSRFEDVQGYDTDKVRRVAKMLLVAIM